MINPPKIGNAPGLTWRKLKGGWEARWVGRADLVKRGFVPKSVQLWSGADLGELDKTFITYQCGRMQAEMLVWGRGGIPVVSAYDETVGGLIDCYETDPDSPYRKLRQHTRGHYSNVFKPIRAQFGDKKIAELRARNILHWHETYLERGTIAMGSSVIKMLRILAGFGATILEDRECERLSGMLGHMRFKMATPRNERVTAERAIAIRAEAHKMGKPSIALGQALQFELMLRQKDVIGEWVNMNEVVPLTDVHDGNSKWLRGLRFEEIDADMILTHVTSKRQKEITVDLKKAGMVMEELQLQFGGVTRDKLPATGPIVISETSGLPWRATEFRRHWRMAATAAGIPKTVKNMDSRAGAISEATDAGADLEHVRHAATHSDIKMTQNYSRNSIEKTAGVMDMRSDFRKNKA